MPTKKRMRITPTWRGSTKPDSGPSIFGPERTPAEQIIVAQHRAAALLETRLRWTGKMRHFRVDEFDEIAKDIWTKEEFDALHPAINFTLGGKEFEAQQPESLVLLALKGQKITLYVESAGNLEGDWLQSNGDHRWIEGLEETGPNQFLVALGS